mmetsp:Transcript_6384/g.16334  ORF Transcript_6384/g.16334 Transcript_6384/m.16334 type:complete len:88 (-) Transcript_6384:317-580(-)
MEEDAAYAAVDALAETDGGHVRELEAREARLRAESEQLQARLERSEALVSKLEARHTVLLANTDKLYMTAKQLVDDADAQLHALRSR